MSGGADSHRHTDTASPHLAADPWQQDPGGRTVQLLILPHLLLSVVHVFEVLNLREIFLAEGAQSNVLHP